jgi:hypothetical protein
MLAGIGDLNQQRGNKMMTVNRNNLKAALLFAANPKIDPRRIALHGVYIESTPAETRLTATNGHALIISRLNREFGGGNVDSHALILSPESIRAILAVKLPKSRPEFTLQKRDDGQWIATLDNTIITCAVIEAQYPDYRRIVPADAPSGELAQFNPVYLANCAAAAQIIKDSKNQSYATVLHNGNNVAVIDCGLSDTLFLVMPMRASGATLSVDKYQWAKGPLADVEPEAEKIAA